MNEIVGAVKRVTDIIGEISAASDEQSSGIEQINQAVMQMDQMTQQNAALVEEAAAAAESMKQQSQQLGEMMTVFRIEDGVEAPVAEVVVERRGPNRAQNVTRLASRAKPEGKGEPAAKAPARTEAKKTGTGDEWREF